MAPFSSATVISRRMVRKVLDWVSWLVASARTATAMVCVPAWPPIEAAMGMRMASATICSIAPSNSAITVEASMAVNRFATSQRTRWT